MVTAEGRAKLSDMGIARRLTADASSFDATTAARAAGTQGWRAPELLESDNSNPRLTRAVALLAQIRLLRGGRTANRRLSEAA